MKQKGIICRVEGSKYHNYVCDKRLSKGDNRICKRCLEEKKELDEFTSKKKRAGSMRYE